MSGIYIALGANLSNKKSSFIKALERLETAGAKIEKVSGLWQSPSWPPGQGHPDYLNAAAKIEFDKGPEALLETLQSIEADMGRVRAAPNAPRPLDLDILDYQGRSLRTERLTLPHPRMLTRGFVLFPLQQISPNWRKEDWHRKSGGDSQNSGHIADYIARLPLRDVAPMTYRGKFWSLPPEFSSGTLRKR